MQEAATSGTERYAAWVANQNIVRFQQLLNTETEDGKRKILAKLLSHEMGKIRDVPHL
jgi:hypothetical protein